MRASHEASGFVIRRLVERSGVEARRIVATGGGSRSVPWMQAVADATGLPVDTVAVPEGAALGAAFLARMVGGLESDFEASGGVGPVPGGGSNPTRRGRRPASSGSTGSRSWDRRTSTGV